MHFYFSATEIECCIFCFFLFSQRVQILKTEYKYGQYCTPLSQSDCRYFFVLAIMKNNHNNNYNNNIDNYKNENKNISSNNITVMQ